MTGGEAHIAIADCYAHCAKALIRSAFWQAEPGAAPTGDAAAFAAATRFMALATVDPHGAADISPKGDPAGRSEEHTSELQSLMRISYAVFCLKKKNIINIYIHHDHTLTTLPNLRYMIHN